MGDHSLPKVYDPSQIEKKWYDFWVEKKFFAQSFGGIRRQIAERHQSGKQT